MISHLFKESVKDFIKEHVQDDPARLPLRFKTIDGTDVKLIAEQILSRQKALKKFPQWAANYDIIFPGAVAVEQASSQTTAQYKGCLFGGNLAIDLTGGLGIDTVALSQHFKTVYYVEKDQFKAEVAKHNFSVLSMHNIEVYNSTAEEFLSSKEVHADLIYLDPDRRAGAGRIVSLEKSTPDVVQLHDQLLSAAGKIMIKTSPMLDIAATINQLSGISEVHVLAVENECRELLFMMSNKADDPVKLTASIYAGSNWQKITTHYPVRESVEVGLPQAFIYEPNSAILKAGMQDLIAKDHGLMKLHPSTHLYTSNSFKENYPGRAFKLQEILPVNKKALKKALPDLKANIATRNFPEHIDKVKKKLQLKDGGKYYLFVCKLSDFTYKILLTEKA